MATIFRLPYVLALVFFTALLVLRSIYDFLNSFVSDFEVLNALSFYGSKMISDPPNNFGQVPTVLDGSKSFWTDPNYKNYSRKV